MKIFQIFQKNENHPIFIEESFSFKALVFQALWLVYYRLWRFVFIVLAINIFLIILQKFSLCSVRTAFLMQFLFSIIIASFAKSWYKQDLIKQGYLLKNLVAANNIEEAKLKYYELMEAEDAI